jgi:hypothetical protein
MSRRLIQIHCRAQVTDKCRKEWVATDEDMTDSTMDESGTVVCFSCYIVIEPFMRMNRHNIPEEANSALSTYHSNLAYARAHPNPQELVEEAKQVIEIAEPGSPYHTSALACKRMAEQEVKNRL